MSPPLYGIIQFHDLLVIDTYWNLSIAKLLDNSIQPNMYEVMMQLYRVGPALPASYVRPSRKMLSERFCQFWLTDPLPLPVPNAETPETKVKREAIIAVGWVYYDVVQSAYNGSTDSPTANGQPNYSYAVKIWTQKNATDLQREFEKLQLWLQSQTN